ncbi:MAG: arylsulfatase [Chlorobi bacterium]|nr:arylsulfatase [Chlorobiota bacterium]
MHKFKLNHIIVFITFSFLFFACSTKNTTDKEQKKSEKPNIIILLSDDQGYGDLGITGNPVFETPNIDKFAKESASMTNFYVSPVCAPTRASLMTGRYNYRTGVTDTYIGGSLMLTEEVTIAEVLKDAGYSTGLFGKWHLGDNYPMRPMDQGFEEALYLKGGGLAQPSDPFENHGRYTNPVLFHNGEKVHTKGFCTDVYYNYAINFMKESLKKNKPFFAYIATNAPHGPFNDVPEDLKQYYLTKEKELASISFEKEPNIDKLAAIGAMITNIDQNVGKLMKELKSLGIDKNTIVIFMSDNGPNSKRYVGNMRGHKGEVTNGGIRTMFYMHWPAVFKGGEKSDVYAAHYDVMPTLLDAAGVKIPESVKLDGRSFLPLLTNKEKDWKDRAIFIQWHRGLKPEEFRNFAMAHQQWTLLSPDASHFELYDITKDPKEENDLAQDYPDKLTEMKEGYMQWFNDVSSTRKNNYATPRIIVGNDAEINSELSRQDWIKDEGKLWGTKGHWLLTVDHDATFDITVKTAKALPGWNVVLKIDDTTLNGTMTDSTAVFKDIKLKKGDITLAASVTRNGHVFPRMHVFVKRVSE